jgi:nitrogen regulatory protein P-II 1
MKKKSKLLFENQNLMMLKALHQIEVNFFSYWDVTGVEMKRKVITYGNNLQFTDIQRRYISVVVTDAFRKKY